MMRAVWKWQLPLAWGQADWELGMPEGAEIVCVAEQGGQPTLWAIVDPDARAEIRRFRIVGTGHAEIEPWDRYVGTAFCGAFVWHVFEIGKPE